MSKELVEKRNDMITRAEEVLNLAKNEKRELTPDEAAELAEIRDNVRKIVETLGLEEDIERLAKEIDAPAEEETADEEREERSMEDKNTLEYRAFDAYLRGTVNERSGELTPSSGSGEAVIPETIANKIVAKIYDIAPVLQRSTRYNVGGTLEIPVYGDTALNDQITVAYATEFSDLTSHSGAFTTVSLGGFVCGALTKISRKLINNARFDIVAFVVDRMAYEIARFIEKELVNPSDPSNKVKGLSTLANGVTAAASNAITLNEIIELHDKVKDEYQQNAIWVMSPATRTALRELKSNTGYPLLNDDIATPFGVSLLGKPVYVSDNMPNMGSGKVTIYYGDFSGLATKFAEDINIEVLRELYAAQHAYGVVGWFEFDAAVENEQKLAKLTMGTTSV